MMLDTKALEGLDLETYMKILNSGMFWELFPSATGIYNEDTKNEEVEVLGED